MNKNPLLLGLFALAACKGSDSAKGDSAASAASATPPAASAAPALPAALTNPDSAELAKPSPAKYTLVFLTSKGEVEVEVTRSNAPHGADRLHYLAVNGFFNGARFFRVVRGFMAQFGLSGRPAVDTVFDKLPIADDPPKLSNRKGTLAFAMRGPKSRTTQMFINLADNSGGGVMLDAQGFAPVGKVVRGIEVAEQWFATYGEMSNQQGLIMSRGNTWLQTRFPELDSIVSVTVKP